MNNSKFAAVRRFRTRESSTEFSQIDITRNFLFDFENSAIVHPSRLFAYCKAVFIGSTPDGLRSTPPQPKIAPFVAYFCNTSPYPNPAVDRLRCCLGHQLFIPSVAVAPRFGPASLRTAADSDVLPPAVAGMLHQPPPGLHQSLLQARQRPILNPLRQCQPPPQIPQVVSQHVRCHEVLYSISPVRDVFLCGTIRM